MATVDLVHEQLGSFETTVNHVYIDVRDRNEILEASMPGYLNVPLSKLSKRHFEAPEPAKFVLTCRSGNRANKALEQAATAFGIPRDRMLVMEGGVLEWTKRGYPVITNTPVPFVHLFYEPTTSTCCYIVVDEETKTCAIIDPVLDYNLSSGEVTTVFADKLLDFVQTNDLVVSHILETHIHADHVTAAAYLKHMLKNHPPVCIGRGVLKVQENMIKILDLPKEDIHPGHFDILWQDKQTFSVGSIPAQVIPTPGHTPDSVTYVIGDSLFCGDSVFYPDVGSARCDFPDGSAELLFKGVKSLYEYPDTFKLFSGHDYPPNRSTAFFAILGQEKKQNKQLNQTTVEQEFVQWRKHRDATLGAPRLLYPSLCFNLKGGRMPRDGFVKTPVKWALNLIQ